MNPLFSVIVVCLNPGSKLMETLNSILEQTCRDYEVIIKDGLSEDGSLKNARDYYDQAGFSSYIKIISQKDAGIYDAMNQAVKSATGQYVYFLNCGDLFYQDTVLSDVKSGMEETGADIFYGSIYERITGQPVSSNPDLNAFGCYRNVPCHQACFYRRELILEHPFFTKYKVRADYEQFLWCFFIKKAKLHCMDIMIADYEGGGFSETRQNRKRSALEHKEITEKYMTTGQIFRFRMILCLTLSPLRTLIAGNKTTAAFYNKIKKILYRVKAPRRQE